MSDSPTLSWECYLCNRCGNVAELLHSRRATEQDTAALRGAVGPVLYIYLMVCANCGRPRIVLAADSGEWYVPGGGD